jgi:polyketide-type polyunsaturated fatty acid synthase PfaA
MTRNKKETSTSVNSKLKTTPIAIIGIGSLFPQAASTQDYWNNILHKVDCVMDVPASRWKVEDYYDPDPSTPDKTYCKRGGFIPDVDFDPLEFGLPPNILEVTDVSQLLSLIVARDALEDAGYGEHREFDRDHTGVVLGVVGMSSKIFTPLMTRLQTPVWEKALLNSGISAPDAEKIIQKMKLAYINWEENAFPGAIGNVVAGRICNRFDLGGTNCVVDAACASSLAALKLAVSELIEHRAYMMISGGVDTDNSINTYMCFSKTPAFSHGEHVRTFDADSDGMMVGEGLGMLVLKRLEDAERDGDRIYAVIEAIGTSSDGRFKSIYAPRPAGQAKALVRAYEEAGFSPSTVGLVEAHGTGTMAGDPSEFQGLSEIFGQDNPRRQYIALGSVKSQIAHTKAAAGAASLIKTALALHHKVLPATINVQRPNPKFGIENTPFYINTETRPWIRAQSAAPRRAGVSSFGFGGTNFHVVLQEYQPEHTAAYRLQRVARPFLFAASDPAHLLATCRERLETLQGDAAAKNFLNLAQDCRDFIPQSAEARVGFVAETADEARQALQICIDTLAAKPTEESWEHPKGIFYRKSGLETQGKVVALFSGQGSQYVDMARDLAVNFPEVREVFSALDELFVQDGAEPLSSRVYPRPVFDAASREAQAQTLTQTEHAQPAIGAISVSLYKLLQAGGFQADFAAGHSFGELTALWAAGVLDELDYYRLAKARGKAMAPPQQDGFDAGTMVAVKGDGNRVREALQGDAAVTVANWNSNDQVVIAGAKSAVAQAEQRLAQAGFKTIPLPVSAAFHTPLVEHAQKPFAQAIHSVNFQSPRIPVYSNSTAQAHAQDPQTIRERLAAHILKPVLFRDEIEQIYADGGRIFVEFGPKNVLTNLVENILSGKAHLAVALNASPKKDSDRQLRESALALRVAGLPMTDFDRYIVDPAPAPQRKKSAVTVKLNGGYYVSEKTRSAFEKALQDGFRVTLPNVNGMDHPIVPQITAAQGAAAPEQTQPKVEPPFDPSREPKMMNAQPAPSFDNSLLAQFQEHQTDTLHLHEQYLRTEEEYARSFAQLIQLQGELVKKAAAGDLAAVLPLFESLERSMARFHEHQSETLRVHQQYLATQDQFSQVYMQKLDGITVFSAPAVIGAPVPAAAPAVTAPAVQPEWVIHPPVQRSEPAPVISAAKPVETAAPALNGQAVKSNGRAIHETAPAPVAASTVAAIPTTAEAQPAGMSREQLTQTLLSIVSEKTGYPVETLELDMDMEADLGIDSIKRVEILGAMQTEFPELPPVDAAELSEMRTLAQIVSKFGESVTAAAPAAAPSAAVAEMVSAPSAPAESVNPAVPAASVSLEEITQALLQVVSEKTGYPVETLELDMDMEADLGIDSIKRVEILGAMQERFPALPQVEASKLAELRTLGQIVDHLSGLSAASTAQPSGGVTAQSPFDPGRDGEYPAFPEIEQGIVVRRLLPAPDCLAYDLPVHSGCLVVDDGSLAAPVLARALAEKGWPVAVLRVEPDGAQNAYPDTIPQVVLSERSEAALEEGLKKAQALAGPAAAFLYLTSSEGAPDLEKERVKLAFLAAKHLKEALTAAARRGRAVFMTVSSLDGEFGLSGKVDFQPVSGGLFGLVKTLNLEWDEVFCRALDFSPSFSDMRVAEAVLAELYDPNRLITEVGYSETGRSTLALEVVPVTGGKR